MPWCPSCSCCRTCTHSDSGICSASSSKVNPSSPVSVEACEKYFLNFFRTSEASSGHPSIIICDSAHSSGSAATASWNAVFHWVVKFVWWIAISRAISGPGWGCYLDNASESAISFLGLNSAQSHRVVFISPFSTIWLGCQPDSCVWSAQGVYGLTLFWSAYHIGKNRIIHIPYQYTGFMLDVGPSTFSVRQCFTGICNWCIILKNSCSKSNFQLIYLESDRFVNIKVPRCCSGRYFILDYFELFLMWRCPIELYVLLCLCPGEFLEIK